MTIKEHELKERLVAACRFIEGTSLIPTLEEVASEVGVSPAYLQKKFSHALGVSPRSYADAVRFNRLRGSLKKGQDVSFALYDAGFGSSSRLYEFAKRYLGMTPRSNQKQGQGERIVYTITQSPLGLLLLAATAKGICSLRFGKTKNQLIGELKQEFQEAIIEANSKPLERWTKALLEYLSARGPWPLLPYDVKATAFQRKVWEYLRTIPSGETYNYALLAKAIGCPKAVRAVANACASNHVALIIPCHRIVPKSGGVGGYRWDSRRKKALLVLEKTFAS